jgi:hypothetical protein
LEAVGCTNAEKYFSHASVAYFFMILEKFSSHGTFAAKIQRPRFRFFSNHIIFLIVLGQYPAWRLQFWLGNTMLIVYADIVVLFDKGI